MSKWSDFYKKRMTQGYVEHVKKQYKPFLDEIINIAKDLDTPQPVLLEAGCGIGTVTKALVQNGLSAKMCAFDLCRDQVYSTDLNLYGLDVNVFVGSILNQESYHQVDIIHSHGVLEHFSDEDIQRVLDIQKTKCKYLVHYVPLAGWVTGSFGDERLLSLEYWIMKFAPNSYKLFNDGKDACFVWKA